MADDEQYNLTAFCESDDLEPASLAICAVNDGLASTQAGLDMFFLIYGGAVVFMMQTGFCMLCAGSIRQKNVKNIMLKNMLDACGGALGFYAVGFGLAFGGDQTGTTFVGNASFGLRNFAGDQYAFFFFQFAFAATAATIVAGTVAERCKMAAYLCYSLFLSGFVYPVVAHSIWDDNGMLTAFRDDPFRGVGCIDFAGSGVVHTVGGVTALIAAIILGPRKGRFYDDDGNPLEEPVSFPPHSVALQVLGTFILWFGWYGFNPASALSVATANGGEVASLAAVTTTMGAAAGCVSCMFLDSIIDAMETGEVSYDLTCAMNGALSGLVAVTAGTATVTPWASILIGAVGGGCYLAMSKLLIRWRIDDAVDAVPVHLANGMWGIIAAGLFSEASLMEKAGYKTDHQGWFYEWGSGSGDANLLLAQVVTLLWIIGWVGGLMTPFFFVLDKLNMFRVDPLEEEVGLDISHHRGAAYDLSGARKEDVEELMEIRASKHGKVEVPREVARAADVAVVAPKAMEEDDEEV